HCSRTLALPRLNERTATLPGDERGRKDRAGIWRVLVLDALEQQLQAHLGHLRYRLGDGGQGWVDGVGQSDVIEADKRHVVRDPVSGPTQGTVDAERNDIVEHEQRGEVDVAPEKIRDGDLSAIETTVAVHPGHGPDPCLPQRSFETREAAGARRDIARTNDAPDFPVPQANQVPASQVAALLVVYQHLIHRHVAHVAIHQNAGHARLEYPMNRVVLVSKRDQPAGDQDQPIDLFREEDVEI